MVCLESIFNGQKVVMLDCYHQIHNHCWDGCKKSSDCCPACRKKTPPGKTTSLAIMKKEDLEHDLKVIDDDNDDEDFTSQYFLMYMGCVLFILLIFVFSILFNKK